MRAGGIVGQASRKGDLRVTRIEILEGCRRKFDDAHMGSGFSVPRIGWRAFRRGASAGQLCDRFV